MKITAVSTLIALLCASSITTANSKKEQDIPYITVGRTCSEPRDERIQAVLIEVICGSDNACFPDPDDMPLWDVEKGESTNWAVSKIVEIDEHDNVITKFRPGKRFTTVWDISLRADIVPITADLSYDGSPYGLDFTLEEKCSIFSDQILENLGVK